MCLYWIGRVSNCSIKSCGMSWSAHEGTIYAHTKALLGKNCLSSHSCHYVKKKILNQTPSCICSMCLHCIGKVSNCSMKSCGRSWSAHEDTINAYTNALLGENCLSFYRCHYVKNYFSWTKLLHAYVQCVYIVVAKYQIVPSKAVVGVRLSSAHQQKSREKVGIKIWKK